MVRRSDIVAWVASAVVLALACHLAFAPRRVWLGKFDLTIHFQSSKESAIKSVRYRDTDPEIDRTSIEHFEWDSLRSALEVDISVYELGIWCMGEDDGWGRRLSYSQHDLVLLQVEFEDSSFVRKL